jgi:hypothetical protein
MDRQQVRVLQPGDEARLAGEALAKSALAQNVGADDLDGHVPLHARLVAAVNGGHATAADFLRDLVLSELLLDHGGGLRTGPVGDWGMGARGSFRNLADREIGWAANPVREQESPFRAYLVGGGTAVQIGWRPSSVDADLFSEQDAEFRDIQGI